MKKKELVIYALECFNRNYNFRYLTEAVGFENSSSIFAIILFIYMIIYCLFGGVFGQPEAKKKEENPLLKVEIEEESIHI